MRCAEDVVHPRLVQAADDLHGVVVGLGEVVRVGLEIEPDAVLLEVGAQLLHRLVEGVLGAQRVVRVAGEFRVDHRALELGGDLQQSAPVAHLRLPFLLVGRRPVEHRDQGQQLDTGFLAGLLDVGDGGVVGLGIAVPEEEVGARRELQVLVAQIRGLANLVGDGQVGVVHRRVECDLHHWCDFLSSHCVSGRVVGRCALHWVECRNRRLTRRAGRWGGAMSNPSPHDRSPRVGRRVRARARRTARASRPGRR